MSTDHSMRNSEVLLNDHIKTAPRRSEPQNPQAHFVATLQRGMKKHFSRPANDNHIERNLLEPFPDGWWASP